MWQSSWPGPLTESKLAVGREEEGNGHFEPKSLDLY